MDCISSHNLGLDDLFELLESLGFQVDRSSKEGFQGNYRCSFVKGAYGWILLLNSLRDSGYRHVAYSDMERFCEEWRQIKVSPEYWENIFVNP